MALPLGPKYHVARQVLAQEQAAARGMLCTDVERAEFRIAPALGQLDRTRKIDRLGRIEPRGLQLLARLARVVRLERDRGQSLAAARKKIGDERPRLQFRRQPEHFKIGVGKHHAVILRAERMESPRRHREAQARESVAGAIEIADRKYKVIDSINMFSHSGLRNLRHYNRVRYASRSHA